MLGVFCARFPPREASIYLTSSCCETSYPYYPFPSQTLLTTKHFSSKDLEKERRRA